MITVIAPAIAILVLTALSWSKFLPEWIQDVPGKVKGWRIALIIGAVLGIGTAGLMYQFMYTLEPYDFRVYTLAILVWLTPLVCLTDFSLYKISAPVSTAVLIALLPNLIYMATVDLTLLWTALLLMILPVLLFFFVMGLGTGDIKLIAMFAIGLNWLTLKEWGWGFIGMAVVSLLGALFILIRGDKLKRIDVEDNLVKQALDNKKNPLAEEGDAYEIDKRPEAQPVDKSTYASEIKKNTGISLAIDINLFGDPEPTEPSAPESDEPVEVIEETASVESPVTISEDTTTAEDVESILAGIDSEEGREAYMKTLGKTNRKIAVEKFVTETSKEINKQLHAESPIKSEETDDDKIISDYFKEQERSLKSIADKEQEEKDSKSKKRKKYATPAGPGFLIGFILIGIYYIYKFGEFIPTSFLDVQ